MKRTSPPLLFHSLIAMWLAAALVMYTPRASATPSKRQQVTTTPPIQEFINGESESLRIQLRNERGGSEHLLVSRREPYQESNGAPLAPNVTFLIGKKRSHHQVLRQVAGSIDSGGTLHLYFVSESGRPLVLSVASAPHSRSGALSAIVRAGRRTRSRFCSGVYADDLRVLSEEQLRVLRNQPRHDVRVRIYPMMDTEYITRNGGETGALRYALETLTMVEALYRTELHLRFDVVSLYRADDPATQPFQSSSEIPLLLEAQEFATTRRPSYHFDVAHLFTGKTFSSSTIGLAFPSAVCTNPDESVSLSKAEDERYDWITLAHEIAHNLGAAHDDSTPSIMSSFVSPHHMHFSNVSRREVFSFVDASRIEGQCLIPDVDTVVNLSPSTPELSVTFYSPAYFWANACTITIYASRFRDDIRTRHFRRQATVYPLLESRVIEVPRLHFRASLKAQEYAHKSTLYLRGYFSCEDGTSAATRSARVSSPYRAAKFLRYLQQSLHAVSLEDAQ